MKLPNGYGSVIKLGGKRRKPYAARITVSWTKDGKQEKKVLPFAEIRKRHIQTVLDNYNGRTFFKKSYEVTLYNDV